MPYREAVATTSRLARSCSFIRSHGWVISTGRRQIESPRIAILTHCCKSTRHSVVWSARPAHPVGDRAIGGNAVRDGKGQDNLCQVKVPFTKERVSLVDQV